MIIKGRVWKYGDNIGAADILSGKYDEIVQKGDWEECAKHVLEDVDANFAQSVQKGDIIITGTNLGHGHGHYHSNAIRAAKAAGVSAIFCDSANTLFIRAAIDDGYPIWKFEGISAVVNSGDEVSIDLTKGTVNNITAGTETQFEPVSEIILSILEAGSSLNWALKRVGYLK